MPVDNGLSKTSTAELPKRHLSADCTTCLITSVEIFMDIDNRPIRQVCKDAMFRTHELSPAARVICRMKFVCPQEWGNLTETKDSNMRHCQVCGRDVHYCESSFELEKAIAAKQCVAFHTGSAKKCDRSSIMLGEPFELYQATPKQNSPSIWRRLLTVFGR
jgi:hypothetical protein